MYEAGHDWDGSPCWLIHDPTANRFHRIGWLEFEFFARWDLGDPQQLLQHIQLETTLRPGEDDLVNFIAFLEQHQLILTDSAAGSAKLASRTKAGKMSVQQWLLHNYLFFRIPLLKPDPLLERLLPLLSPLLTTNAMLLTLLTALAGLFLAARQWDVFIGSFANTLTPAGFISYSVAIVIAKCCHELGHALSAKKAGLRVPRIGIAFLVMFPVLYTDLGEGWLLHDHRQRRHISAAGMIAEGALAAVALFMWGITGAGALRDAWYILAVVSLTRSLLINISPFMRFDGYYILSDHLNIPNLQQRAFASTRHLLRQWIFGLNDEPPELLPTRLVRFFVIYSLATWLYRLVVFFGIALTVYHYFFKSLGIILMLVELLYFIALPIIRELQTWRKQMSRISTMRSLVLNGSLALLLLLLLLPWKHPVTLPAILTAHVKQPVYAPFAARIMKLADPDKEVKKGAQLALLDADETRFQAHLARMQASELRDRLRRLPMQQKGREQEAVWREEALEREQAARAQTAELHRLELKAESDGIFMDRDEGVHAGSYVTPHTLLGTVVDPSSTEIEAFADEIAANRIKAGLKVRFFCSSDPRKIYHGRIVSLDSSRLLSLPTPALADRHGGTIATVPSNTERLIPRDSLYRVRIKLDTPLLNSQLQTGSVAIDVEPESIASNLIRHALSVFIRESGF